MDISFTAQEEACRDLKEMSDMDQAGTTKSVSTTAVWASSRSNQP